MVVLDDSASSSSSVAGIASPRLLFTSSCSKPRMRCLMAMNCGVNVTAAARGRATTEPFRVKRYALTGGPTPALPSALSAQAHERQRNAKPGHQRSDDRPGRHARHRAAGQVAQTLQGPHTAHQDEHAAEHQQKCLPHPCIVGLWRGRG